MRRLRLGFAAGTLLVGGCALVQPPDDHTEELTLPIPSQWTAQPPEEAATFADGWLDDFADPALRDLVHEAVRHNYDLQAAAARIEVFRANTIIASADLWPALDGSGSMARTVRSVPFEDATDSFRLGLAMSWELDIWGRLRDRARAAIADFQATASDYRAARLSLAAQTASVWFDAVEAELQVRLAENTVRSFENSLTVVEERYQRGLSTALDVHLSRANVASARSSLEFRRRQRDAAVRRLEVLLGRYPARQLELADRLPRIVESVPAGLPADLLRRRPDLIRAERLLAAADERLSVAQKNLLPTIRLTGSVDTGGDDFKDAFNANLSVWTLAGNAVQPIFQGRRLTAAADRSDAERFEAWASFSQTALRAFEEVEAALAAERYLADEEAAIRDTVEQSTEAERLALEEYGRGIPGVDIITVLESQRRSFNSQQQLLSIANDRLQNRVALYLALGGDFYSPPPPPAPADQAPDADPASEPARTPRAAAEDHERPADSTPG